MFDITVPATFLYVAPLAVFSGLPPALFFGPPALLFAVAELVAGFSAAVVAAAPSFALLAVSSDSLPMLFFAPPPCVVLPPRAWTRAKR